jgi:tetratricopeptide (TPR) repeat protein
MIDKSKRTETPAKRHAAGWQILLVSAALAVSILAAFEGVRHNEFVRYDDPEYITENPHIQSGLTAQTIKWAFTSGYAANWHPLTWLSHALDVQLFGMNPLGHHLHSLALHIATTILLFWVLQSMTGALWPSAFVAMVFGLHPLHVESVAWAAQRKDVLCVFFWMLTMAAYLSYARRGGALRYLLVVACFALGLMAEPVIVTLPVILVVLDFWPLGRMSKAHADEDAADVSLAKFRQASLIRLIVEKVPLFVLALASAIVTFLVQQKGGTTADVDFGLGFRISNAIVSMIGYLYKIVWPVGLAVVYPLPLDGWPAWKPMVGVIALALVSAFVVCSAKKRPWLLTGWVWYLVTLIPVIGLVQVGSQALADRYTYLPSVGILIMLSWAAAELSAGWPHRAAIGAVLSGLVGAAMIIGTHTQVSYWKDSASLYAHALSVTRDNYIIERYLGTLLQNRGRLDEAEEHYRRSVRIHPGFTEGYLALGQMLETEGKLGEAVQLYEQAAKLNPSDYQPFYKIGAIEAQQGSLDDAARHLRQSIQLNPSFARAHVDLGQVFAAQGKYDDAIRCYEQAIRLNPTDFKSYSKMGVAKARKGLANEAADCFRQSIQLKSDYAESHLGLGIVLQEQGRIDEAAAQFRSVLKVEPDDYAALANLADCLQIQGKTQEAIDSYNRALKLKPDDASIHSRLGQALKEQGRLAETVAQHRSALAIDPNFAPSLNNLAWTLATTQDGTIRNPSEAVRLAERVCVLTSFEDYNCLDTLAAAYAGEGQFDKAVQTAQKAIALAKAANEPASVEDISKKLQLYQAKQAYIEPSPPR